MMFPRNVLPSRLLIVLCISLLIGVVLYLQKDTPSGNLVGQVGSSANNSIVTVDELGEVGWRSSIIKGQDGLAIISYYDRTSKDLKFVKCNNDTCSLKTITVVDSEGSVGRYGSIAIAGGLPVISYADETNKDLKLAVCNNDTCSDKTLTIVDDVWTADTDVTIGGNGFPVISYRDSTSANLKVAKCNNADCSLKTITVVDANGGWSSIVMGGDGLPVISYINPGLNDLKVIKCHNADCSDTTVKTVDPVGRIRGFTSIAIGGDDMPVIGYYDDDKDDLKFAKCNNADCSSKTLTTVDSIGNVGMYVAITVGGDGLAIISYWDYTNRSLKVAKCNNPTCSSKKITTVDAAGQVGMSSSITIGADGLPIISYYDDANKDLKVAKCTTASCENTSSITTPVSSSQASSLASSVASSQVASVASLVVASQASSMASSLASSLSSIAPAGATEEAPSSSSFSASLPAIISCTPCDNISCTGSNKCYASNAGGTMCLESGLVNALWKECGVVSVGSSSQASSATALVASSQASVSCPAAAIEPSGGTQVFESNSLQAAAGITIKAHAHNLFECPAGSTSVAVIGSSLLEQCNRFWVYEYSGQEQARTDANTSPIFNGKFFISGAELSLQQGRANAPGASDAQKDFYTWLDDHNNLVNFVSGKSYYIMSEIDLQFSCSTGLQLPSQGGSTSSVSSTSLSASDTDIVSIANNHSDAPTSSVPIGIASFGTFLITTREDSTLEGLIFNVETDNLTLDATSFKFFNADIPLSDKKICTTYPSGSSVPTTGIASGSLIIDCNGLSASTVNTLILGGTSSNFSLEASVTNEQINPSQGSSLEVSLQDFTSSSATAYGIESGKSHIKWIDSSDDTFYWVDQSNSVVRSTKYES